MEFQNYFKRFVLCFWINFMITFDFSMRIFERFGINPADTNLRKEELVKELHFEMKNMNLFRGIYLS